MALRRKDFEGLRDRLKSGKLTPKDVTVLSQLLKAFTGEPTRKTIGGRPVVAHLPFGMDVIK